MQPWLELPRAPASGCRRERPGVAVLPFLSLISRGAGRAPALRAFALMAAVGLAILTTTGASAQQVTPRPLAGDELPWDVSAVLGAVLLAMRSTGEVDTTPVTIARGAIDSVREPGFDYSGFRMDRVVISQYGAAPAGEGLVLAAALSFADPSGRRTAFSLSADYRAQDGRLLITRAGLLPLAPVNPAVRQFILPGELAAKMPQGGAVTLPRYSTT